MVVTKCPSCSAKTTVLTAVIPDDGFMTKCERCGKPFVARAELSATSAPPGRKVGAFTIQSRSESRPEVGPQNEVVGAEPSELGPSLRQQKIASRLRPFRNKTYYEVLRVAPGGPRDQLQRAYAYMMQTEAPDRADPGFDAWKDLVDEAFSRLSDERFARKYERLVIDSKMSPKARKKRQTLEVDPKVHRLTVAIAKNALGEANYLNEWTRALDPDRRDLAADAAFIKFRSAPAAARKDAALRARTVIEPLARRWFADTRLKLYLVILISTTDTIKKAKRVMKRVSDEGHPLYKVAEKTLDYRTRR